jgi:hypothetical protein
LEKAFDDMTDTEEDDDEDGTMNSTRNDHSVGIHNSNNRSSNRDFPLRDDFSNLRNLVETKSRELEHVSNILANERKAHKTAIDEYEKRLSIAEAEKERVSLYNV